jgi:hypothetical protein
VPRAAARRVRTLRFGIGDPCCEEMGSAYRMQLLTARERYDGSEEFVFSGPDVVLILWPLIGLGSWIDPRSNEPLTIFDLPNA